MNVLAFRNGTRRPRTSRRAARLYSTLLIGLMVSGVLAVPGIPALSNVAHASNMTQTQQDSAATALPLGLPNYTSLVTRGEFLVSIVQSSQQYKSLSQANTFYVDPHASFGFSAGPVKQDDYEIITLFSPNHETYIQAEVNNTTNAIIDMSFTNLTSTAREFSSSSNWSGYSAPDCANSLFGYCFNFYTVVEAYGDIQAPNSLSAPKTEQACCSFAEWTGAGNDDGGTGMVQGGYAWAGFQLRALPHANSNGYALWVEDIYDSYPPTYISPPSWMNGVSGETVTLETGALSACKPTSSEWFEIWQLGSSSMEQVIACVPYNAYTWGYYMLESPALPQCSATGWNGLCQLPEFNTVSFTGNVCGLTSGCEYINSNNNAGLVGWYIVHNTQDTTTGGIPSNGNQWYESWDSPGT